MKQIWILLLCFFSLSATAQRLTHIPQAGSRHHRISIDSTLFFPTGCGVPYKLNMKNWNLGLDSMKAAFYYDSCNAKLYVYDPKPRTWSQVTGGSLDTTGKFVNAVTSINDSTIRVFKGNTHIDLVIKGGIGAGGGSNPQAIDITLRRGNTTRQTLVFDDTTATSTGTLYTTELKPRNYGTSYTTGRAGSYVTGYGNYPGVNADGRPNNVFLIAGYNGGFNSKVFSTEATWGIRAETWYQLGGVGHSEFHLWPEFNPITGVPRRTGSLYTNNVTGYTTFNSQIDAFNLLRGSSDTVMFSVAPTQGTFAFKGAGSVIIYNADSSANYFSINKGLQSTNFSINTPSSAAAAGSYMNFQSPVLFTTSSIYGTTNTSAATSTVTVANYAGFKVVGSGLSAAAFKGMTADVSTSGVFDMIWARNLGTGTTQAFLQMNSGGKGQYVLSDASTGQTFNMAYTGGNTLRTFRIDPGTDSAFFIRAVSKAVYAKYNLSIGTTDPTARLMLPPGTATASTAPLKFVSGPATTTPETGAIHFTNGLLMLDSSTAVRDTLATRKWARNTLVANAYAGSYSNAVTSVSTFTVTITGTMANTTYVVNVTPTGTLTSGAFYVTNKTTTTFDIVSTTALTGTVTYDWSVIPN